MTLTWKRINTGIYQARTGPAQLDRYLVENLNGEWFLTYPGQDFADGVAATRRQCTDWAIDHQGEVLT